MGSCWRSLLLLVVFAGAGFGRLLRRLCGRRPFRCALGCFRVLLRGRFVLRTSKLFELSHSVFDRDVLRVHRRATRRDELHLDESVQAGLDVTRVFVEFGRDFGLQKSIGLVLLLGEKADDFFVESLTFEFRLDALVVARRRTMRRGSFRRTSFGRSRNGDRFASFGARVRLRLRSGHGENRLLSAMVAKVGR